ncbi:rifin PIR protein, putative [Plasmodium reichenowi]|uniref:Rifin PIR protein, putative n=1 Tax=Plasmodium reichenowi TaxID=5854 RepID=A0A2P9DHC5_PLARE|nr:rifin PIR protein, putative [Plasmodium reichenowi]
MKVHYINILLFALPLNILVNTHKKPFITPHHTQDIPTIRSLCECELYAPANYDNDPQMKKVMENFNKQTQERFHEYDERMKTTRQKCKEQCDKEIQKIILKDKLEKELTEKFTTLHTDIQSDAIPTCICEKSLADKMEKGCLRCGYGLGTVVPTVGLIGSVAVNVLKTAKIAAATQEAIAKGAAEGLAAGNAHGMNIVIKYLEQFSVKDLLPEIFKEISNIDHFAKVTNFAQSIFTQKLQVCSASASSKGNRAMCETFDFSFGLRSAKTGDPIGAPGENPIPKVLNNLVEQAEQAAAEVTKTATKEATKAAIDTSTKAIDAAGYNLYSSIGYSVLAILIIVLIMVIIYLILRYRRKKKMKKKLQYIKLLEE